LSKYFLQCLTIADILVPGGFVDECNDPDDRKASIDDFGGFSDVCLTLGKRSSDVRVVEDVTNQRKNFAW